MIKWWNICIQKDQSDDPSIGSCIFSRLLLLPLWCHRSTNE
jgi:hypothetical protein